MACGVTGVIGMIIVAANLFTYTPASVVVTLEVGYYGEWLGFLILAGVGFFALRQMSTQISPVTIPSLQVNPSNPIASAPSVPPPLPNTVPHANPTGLGSNTLNPNPIAPATPAKNSTPKKNNWKEIG